MFDGQIDLNIEMQNNITYWYPVLQKLRIRTPKTIIVHNHVGTELFNLLDRKEPDGWKELKNQILSAIAIVGVPCLIKTGLLSNKHDLEKSCYVTDPVMILKHVCNLIEASAMANIAGAPFDISYFAIRKIIPTKTVFKAFHGNMPITKERRLFVKGGKVMCEHPYWPREAFKHYRKIEGDEFKELWDISDEDLSEIKSMAEKVSEVLSGYWSIDFLQDVDGKWWCIDMARGEVSYHWSDCLEQMVSVKPQSR